MRPINTLQEAIVEIKRLSDAVDELQRRVSQREIVQKTVKQRHIDGIIVIKGLAADRPSGETDVQAYWATDTGVLSIWSGTAWLSETLT